MGMTREQRVSRKRGGLEEGVGTPFARSSDNREFGGDMISKDLPTYFWLCFNVRRRSRARQNVPNSHCLQTVQDEAVGCDGPENPGRRIERKFCFFLAATVERFFRHWNHPAWRRSAFTRSAGHPTLLSYTINLLVLCHD